MAEPLVNGLDPRKKLYSALVGSSDKELAGQVKQFSYNKFNGLLDNNDFVRDLFMDISERGIVLDSKNPNASKDPVEFANAFIYREPVAKPQPKVQAAPAMQMAAPMEEEEAYTPPPQPLVGTPEYDAQLQAQYGGMSPTLGATFGGVPASFETKAQKKQEQISPVFKAQQLAFEDVPIAEEQRKAQRQFAKAEKQQQQAALRGGTGFEYQQEQKNKERGYGAAKAEDLLESITSGGERIAKNVLSGIAWLNQASMAADPNMPLEYEQRQQQIKDASQRMYDASASSQNQFQEELAKRNIQTSILEAIDKGNYGRIPEATLYTIGDAAMQIIPSILTMGGSTYFQTLPEAYKNGVDAIAKEKGMTPEQVIASGDDALLTAQISSGIQSALERVGAGLVSKSIASRGGYKAMRDWLLKQGVNRNLARGASLLGVSGGEALTEYGQEGVAQIGEIAAKSPTARAFMDKLPKELFTPEATKRRAESLVGGLVGGFGLAGGGQAFQSAMDRTLFETPKIGKASQRADMDIVQTDNKIQERNKIAQAMEEAVKGNPEAEGQIRAQYQKRVNEAAPTDEEVLNAYEGLAALPETEEKNTIRENLEAYMAEKGIQPEAAGMDAGLGEGLRVTAPSEETMPPTPPVEPVAPEITPTETAPFEEVPVEDAIQEDEDLASLGQTISGLEQAPVEEVAPEVAPEQIVPAEEETPVEEVAPQPKAGDFVIVNGEKGVVVVTPGGQMSVETDTKIYDLDERGIAGIGGRLVAPKEQTQTEYEVEVIDDDNAIVNGESFKIIRDEKGNTIALQGETRTIRTEPVMVDVDIKRNKAQVKETLQEQSAEVETLSPDMTLDKQGFVDDIIGHNMTEGVDRILSEGVTDKTAERDLLQFKLFVEATIADLRARQKGNPYAEAMIEQLQEALNTVYYEYYSQGRKAEARTSKPQKKTDRGVKGKERVSPKPAEGKQPAAPVKPTPVKTNEQQIADLRAKEQAELDSKIKDANKYRGKDGKVDRSKLTNKADIKAFDEVYAKYDKLISPLMETKPEPKKEKTPKPEPKKEEPKKEETPKPEAKEAKPTTGTPQEGDTVEIAPQREGGSPRKMVFKDGEWKQNVGGDIVKVGPSVQQQAQEAFGGKAEAKPAETKAEPTAKKIDKKSVQDSLEKAKEEYEKAKGAFDKKRSELDKTTREDVKDLFGERKVEMKAKGLFEMPRISPEQRERAIQPFRDRMNKAKEEVNRLTKMLEEGEEVAKELTFEKQKEYEQLQGVSKETRKGKSTPKTERVVRPKAKPIRNAGKNPDAITARNIAFYGDPVATTLQYLMDATYHPDLLESIFGGPSKTTKSGRKDISGERRSRIQFLDNNSNVKTADKLAEVLAERYAEENSIDVKDAEQQHDFASIAIDIVSSYSSRSQMVRELLRLNDQQSEAFDFMYNPEEIYGEGYNEDIAKDIDGILDELPDSYWEGKEISDEDFGNLFAEEVESETKAEAEFNSKQESSASQEFDGIKKPSKIKTKSFDGKHGKGAFERMKNITDNFEDIMDGMSGKIKQDCL